MIKKLIIILMLASTFGCGQALKFGKLGQGFREFGTRSLFFDTIDKKLYASGQFKFADNKIVWGTAVWNGTQWDSLRGGFTQFPQDTNGGSNASSFAWQIIRFQNKHYFIGNMVWINGKNQYNMGVWNGTNWDYPIAQPPNGPVYNLTVHNNELYAAGMFTKFGNTTCNYVAKFDGVSWQPVGDFTKYIKSYSPPARVQAVQWYKNELYLGGSFLDSAGRNTNIVKFDGTKWTTVGTGINEGFAWVNRMTVFKNELYLGGYFSKTAEIPSSSLVKWNGTSFKPYGTYQFSEGTTIMGLLPHKDKLYISGNFHQLGNFNAFNSMFLDTISGCAVSGLESTFSHSLNTGITEIEFLGDSMVLGGWYKYLDTLAVNNIGVMYNYQSNLNCLYTSLKSINSENSNFSIYPNPFNNKFTINTNSTEHYNLIITNTLGQVILNKKIIEQIIEFDLSTYPSGIYFVTVSEGDNRKVLKLIKE